MMNYAECKLSKIDIFGCKEPTEVWGSALKQRGLNCEVMRQPNQPEYKDYSPCVIQLTFLLITSLPQ